MLFVFLSLSLSRELKVDSNNGMKKYRGEIKDVDDYILINNTKGYQVFLFTNRQAKSLKINEKEYDTKYSHGLAIEGEKATVTFNGNAKFVVYMIPKGTCNSSVYAMGGKRNNIRFHLNKVQSDHTTCAFIPTFGKEGNATYKYGSNYEPKSIFYKLIPIGKSSGLMTNSLSEVTTVESYGVFKPGHTNELRFERKYNSEDKSFVSECFDSAQVLRCGINNQYQACERMSEDLELDNLSCHFSDLNIGLIVGIVVAVVVVIVLIIVLLCCGFCAYIFGFRGRHHYSSS